MYHAQPGQKAVMLVRLEPTTLELQTSTLSLRHCAPYHALNGMFGV